MATGPQNECSRRRFYVSSVAAAAIGTITGEADAVPASAAGNPAAAALTSSNTLVTAEGTQIYFKGWGGGQPVVFSHGWPLNSDAFENQMFYLASQDSRCIVHDRGRHGRSGQPWGGNDVATYADDLAALVRVLNLKNAVHVGHSTGEGEVARYIGRHGTERVAKTVLIRFISPTLLKTTANPDGIPIKVFDRTCALAQAYLSESWKTSARLSTTLTDRRRRSRMGSAPQSSMGQFHPPRSRRRQSRARHWAARP